MPTRDGKASQSAKPGLSIASIGTLATNDYRRPKVNGSIFQVAWGFKGDAVPRISEMLKGVPHPWIHACCGAAVIPGEDVRVDLHHPSGQPLDVQFIDQHYQNAGAIIIDPPYGEEAWDLPMRQRVMSACSRALAPGGVLIVHAPWQPKFPRRTMKRREPVYVRDDAQLDWPMAPVMLAAYDKTNDPGLSGRARRHQRERA